MKNTLYTYTHSSRILGALAALALLGTTPLSAVNIDWTGPSGNWDVEDNWTIAGTSTHQVPSGSGDSGFIGSTTPGLEATLNSTASVGNLSIGRDSTGTPNLSATLLIENGADLNVSWGMSVGYSSNSTGSVTQTGGIATVYSGVTLGSFGNTINGYYTIEGGTLDVKTSGNGIKIGNKGNGYFYQNGGTVNTTTLVVGFNVPGAVNTALYEVNGGSLTASESLSIGHTNTTSFSAATDAKMEINGSSAVINVNGDMAMNDTAYSSPTLTYQVDNGGVTKINLTGSGTATLAGTLELGFKGGVALVDSTSLTLVEANTGNVTGGFTTEPNPNLWTTSITAVSDTRDALVATLNPSAQLGTLAADSGTLVGTTFAAASYGYVNLSNLEAGKAMTIYLDADAGTGMTLTDLVAYFTENDIDASLISEGDYDMAIAYTGTQEIETFAWDLSAFNTDATVSGIGITTAIPEPSSMSVILGASLGLLALSRKLRAGM